MNSSPLPPDNSADSINFVLCPGKAYDRSPCGTGTSAKLACLAADGKLEPGHTWRQAGILGTAFEGSYEMDGELLIPTITGEAFITSEANLVFESDDPFRNGFLSGEPAMAEGTPEHVVIIGGGVIGTACACSSRKLACGSPLWTGLDRKRMFFRQLRLCLPQSCPPVKPTRGSGTHTEGL